MDKSKFLIKEKTNTKKKMVKALKLKKELGEEYLLRFK